MACALCWHLTSKILDASILPPLKIFRTSLKCGVEKRTKPALVGGFLSAVGDLAVFSLSRVACNLVGVNLLGGARLSIIATLLTPYVSHAVHSTASGARARNGLHCTESAGRAYFANCACVDFGSCLALVLYDVATCFAVCLV